MKHKREPRIEHVEWHFFRRERPVSCFRVERYEMAESQASVVMARELQKIDKFLSVAASDLSTAGLTIAHHVGTPGGNKSSSSTVFHTISPFHPRSFFVFDFFFFDFLLRRFAPPRHCINHRPAA